MRQQQSELFTDDWSGDSGFVQLLDGRAVRVTRVLVQQPDALRAMAERLRTESRVSFDTETSGLQTHMGARICGYAYGAFDGGDEMSITSWYAPVGHVGPANERIAQLDRALAAEAARESLCSAGECAYHNLKFEWNMLAEERVVPTRHARDVAILATAYDERERSFALKELAKKYLSEGAKASKDEIDDWMRADARTLGLKFRKRGKQDGDELGEPTYTERFGYSRVPVPLAARYACLDAVWTLLLRHVTYRGVEQRYPLLVAREHKVAYRLHRAERVGLPVNVPLIRRVHETTRSEYEHWLGEARRLSGMPEFDCTDDEVRELLFDRLQLEPQKMTSKNENAKKSVDEEARHLLREKYPQVRPLLDAIDSLASARKVHSTYAASFLRFLNFETGRIHPAYNQIEERELGGVPVTGRLSSSSPNAQNVQKKPLKLRDGTEITVRDYFLVPEGFVRLWFDWSQIELRTLVWYCRDPVMLRAFAEDRDLHQVVADELAIERKKAKECNFLMVFGGTERALALRLPGYHSDPKGKLAEAERYLNAYHAKFRSIGEFMRSFAARIRRTNGEFENPFGRPRRIPEVGEWNRWKRERAQRQMMSSLVSGTAADIMKESMIRCGEIIDAEPTVDGKRPELVQTVHDELVFDLPIRPGWARLIPPLARAMTDWPEFSNVGVPIKVNIDISTTHWGDKRGIQVLPDGTFRWAA